MNPGAFEEPSLFIGLLGAVILFALQPVVNAVVNKYALRARQIALQRDSWPPVPELLTTGIVAAVKPNDEALRLLYLDIFILRFLAFLCVIAIVWAALQVAFGVNYLPIAVLLVLSLATMIFRNVVKETLEAREPQ